VTKISQRGSDPARSAQSAQCKHGPTRYVSLFAHNRHGRTRYPVSRLSRFARNRHGRTRYPVSRLSRYPVSRLSRFDGRARNVAIIWAATMAHDF